MQYELDTTKSIYKPIEVKVNGVVYHVKRLTRPMFAQIRESQLKLQKEGDMEQHFIQIELLTDIPREVLDLLDFPDVREMARYIATQAFGERQKAEPEAEEEKNAQKLGGEPLPTSPTGSPDSSPTPTSSS